MAIPTKIKVGMTILTKKNKELNVSISIHLILMCVTYTEMN